MVSIIVPFNNTKYLKQNLENLIDLNYRDYEIILIDDFSVDSSSSENNAHDILKELKIEYSENGINKFPNVEIYYTTEKTVGVGNARNLGLQKASGEYIMFVDVDDTIDENLLMNLQKYIDENIDMIKYKMKIIEKDKKFFADGPVFSKLSGEDAFNKLCFKDIFLDSPCLYLIKKEFLEKTNLRFEKNVYHEDFGLIPELILNANSVVSTDYYGYNYIQTEDSIMRNNDYSKEIKKANDKMFHYYNLEKNLSNYEILDNTRDNIFSYYTNSIIQSIKHLNYDDRAIFEKKIKEQGLIKNIKPKSFKQKLKKFILERNIELYIKSTK